MKKKEYFIDKACSDKLVSVPDKSKAIFKAIEDNDIDLVEKLLEEMAK